MMMPGGVVRRRRIPWVVPMVGVIAALLPAGAGAEGELPEGIPACPAAPQPPPHEE